MRHQAAPNIFMPHVDLNDPVQLRPIVREPEPLTPSEDERRPFQADWWVICHRPTGSTLAPGAGPRGRGGSHAVFGYGEPRLFFNKASAKAALRAWLQGRWYGDGEGSVDVTADPRRQVIADEIDVLPIRFEFRTADIHA